MFDDVVQDFCHDDLDPRQHRCRSNHARPACSACRAARRAPQMGRCKASASCAEHCMKSRGSHSASTLIDRPSLPVSGSPTATVAVSWITKTESIRVRRKTFSTVGGQCREFQDDVPAQAASSRRRWHPSRCCRRNRHRSDPEPRDPGPPSASSRIRSLKAIALAASIRLSKTVINVASGNCSAVSCMAASGWLSCPDARGRKGYHSVWSQHRI